MGRVIIRKVLFVSQPKEMDAENNVINNNINAAAAAVAVPPANASRRITAAFITYADGSHGLLMRCYQGTELLYSWTCELDWASSDDEEEEPQHPQQQQPQGEIEE
jgi:hypothetical protein